MDIIDLEGTIINHKKQVIISNNYRNFKFSLKVKTNYNNLIIFMFFRVVTISSKLIMLVLIKRKVT